MKNSIKNIGKSIIIILLLLIPIAGIIINSPLIVGDELWNFQNVMKMVRGLKIYQDCNVIITPILFYVGEVFLKLLGANILSFRIYNIAIFLFFCMAVFELFSVFEKDKIKRFTYTCIIFMFIMPYTDSGANYNVLATAFYILGLFVFLKYKEKKYYSIFAGIIIYLVLFTKQNVGFLYIGTVILCEFLTNKKRAFKRLFCQGGIAIILCTINLLILGLTGSLGGFINYTILGMKSFAGKNFSLSQGYTIIIILEIIFALGVYPLYIVLHKKGAFEDKKHFFRDLLIFAVFLNLSVFPIVNLYHTCFAICLNLIAYIILVDKFVFSEFQKINKVLCILVYIFLNVYGIIYGIKYQHNVKITDKQSPYFYCNMAEEINQNIKEVTNYIKNKKEQGIEVIVLSQDAGLYMIPLQENHGELDLAFKGNLGYQGEDQLIKTLDDMEDMEVLLNRDFYWQEVEEARMYIFSHYKKIGEIADYVIFTNK